MFHIDLSCQGQILESCLPDMQPGGLMDIYCIFTATGTLPIRHVQCSGLILSLVNSCSSFKAHPEYLGWRYTLRLQCTGIQLFVESFLRQSHSVNSIAAFAQIALHAMDCMVRFEMSFTSRSCLCAMQLGRNPENPCRFTDLVWWTILSCVSFPILCGSFHVDVRLLDVHSNPVRKLSQLWPGSCKG